MSGTATKKAATPKKNVSIIPSWKEHDKAAHPVQEKQRVAAYCRVSTLLEQQESSFEAQKSGNVTNSTGCCGTVRPGRSIWC